MKVRLFVSLMMGLLASCSEALAQEVNDGSEALAQNAAKKGKEKDTAQDSIALQEVVVKAARVVNKVDGKLIFPSEVQKQNSHSGFSLLGKLMLPNIRVDELSRSIVAIKGEVCKFVSMASLPMCMRCKPWMSLRLRVSIISTVLV